MKKENYFRKTRHPDLTNDAVFRYYFSTNKEVLLSLIRSFLPTAVEIVDIQIMDEEKTQQFGKLLYLDTSIPPILLNQKHIKFDVLVKLASGEFANIEMQRYKQKYWQDRFMFYCTDVHSRNFKKGAPYQNLKSTYSLIFTAFDAFGDKAKGFIHSHSMRLDTEPYWLFSKALNVIVVVLPQVPSTAFKSLALNEKWCYLIKHSANLSDLAREHLEEDEEIKMALEYLDEIGEKQELSYAEWARRRDLQMWKMERNSLLADGKEQGMAEGIAKGKAEGMAKGEEKKQKEIALRMLETGFTLADTAKATGLSEQEIARLNGHLSARS